jgi:hypothetical protein
MKRGLLTLVTLVALVVTQLTVGGAQAGGHYKRHGPGYSGGHYKSHGGHYKSHRGHYKSHRGHYSGHRGHGQKHRGYGYGYRYDDSYKYDYLLGGLLLGGAATYLLSQPRYVERQSVVYQPAPAVVVNPTVGSVLEYNRTGQATAWQDPDTGNTFTTTPVRTHMTSAGPCREYIMSVMIGGQEQQAYGTACRENDGSWKLQR